MTQGEITALVLIGIFAFGGLFLSNKNGKGGGGSSSGSNKGSAS